MQTMSRRSFLRAALGVASLGLAGCGSGASGAASTSAASASAASASAVPPSSASSCVTSASGEYASGTHHATIEVEGYGAIRHVRGTFSMSRSQAFNSASSLFFIMQADSPNLDGQYAAFGHVTEGMDFVDAMCEAARPTDNNGTIAAADQPRIASVKMDD